MIPPLVLRCPECGNAGLRRRFAVVDAGGRRLAECPACGRRFEAIDDPLLK